MDDYFGEIMKKINYGGKVTIDNIRRSLSAFLSWLEALFVSLNKPHKFRRTMATRAI